MYSNYVLLVIRCLVVMQVSVLYAQHDTLPQCSGCPCDKDLSPVGISMSTIHHKGEWMLAYKPMFMQGKGMTYANQSVTNEEVLQQYLMTSDKMRMQMHMLMAMYGISDKLTLMGMVDYRVNTMNMYMMPGHVHGGASVSDTFTTMTTHGIGDLSISALYGIINTSHNVLMGTLGISLPTGSINQSGGHSGMYHEQRYPYMMQNGSGTFDGILKLTYTRNYLKTQYGAQASSLLRMGYNKNDYKWGNEYAISAWASKRWMSLFSSSIRMEYVYTTPIKGRDPSLYSYMEPAANTQNYGGQRLLGHIGTFVYFLHTQKLGLEFGLPLFQDLNGYQTPLQYQIQALYSIGF